MILLPRKYRIAVLPGDGIGREVVPESLRVLKAAEEVISGFTLEFHEFECGGEYYQREGREWSQEAEEFSKNEADAVLLGAVGAAGPDGETVRRPDGHLAGYSIVIGMRIELELFANVRPVKLYEGVPTPLAGKDHRHVNMIMVRENTEGLYAPQEAPARANDAEVVIDKRTISRKASSRVSEFAFELAMKGKGAPLDSVKRVTCVDKSNLLAGCRLFRNSFDEIGERYPEVSRDYAYVDAFTQWLIRRPEFYNIAVAPNEFGDIITDLGAAIQGGLGMAPAGSIGYDKAVFEPVHGSAPKYYGQRISNPIAAILSGMMMVDWLGRRYADERLSRASRTIEESVMSVLQEGKKRTYDICIGRWSEIAPSSSREVTDAIIEAIHEKAKE